MNCLLASSGCQSILRANNFRIAPRFHIEKNCPHNCNTYYGQSTITKWNCSPDLGLPKSWWAHSMRQSVQMFQHILQRQFIELQLKHVSNERSKGERSGINHQLLNCQTVLPYLVVCDQIGRFQSLLVGRFSVRSLVVFWSFLGFLAIPIKFWVFGKTQFWQLHFAVFWQIFKGVVIKVTKMIGSLCVCSWPVYFITIIYWKVVILTAENLLIYTTLHYLPWVFINFLECELSRVNSESQKKKIL